MVLAEYKDYSVKYIEGKWFFSKPTGKFEITEDLDSYLIFLPVLEFSPIQFIEKLNFFYQGGFAKRKFPIEEIVGFAIKHDDDYWLKLAIGWLPYLSVSLTLINIIKTRLIDSKKTPLQNELFKHVVAWNRSNAKKIYEQITVFEESLQVNKFMSLLTEQKIDYIKLKENVIVVNGLKFLFPVKTVIQRN
jgi:hypothetical protein